MRTEMTYLSANGKNTVYAVQYLPDTQDAKGVIHLVHGFSENMELYEETMEFLAKQGYAVCGQDLIGHGKSWKKGDVPNHIGEKGSWQDVLEDVRYLQRRMKALFPDIPYCFLGHSLGSYLVRCLLITDPQMADAVILSGSGMYSKPDKIIGNLLADYAIRKGGWADDGDFMQMVLHGTNTRKIRDAESMYDWLLKDRSCLEEMMKHVRNEARMTAGTFKEMLSGIAYATSFAQAKGMRDIPVLFVNGKEDPLAQNGRNVEKAVRFFRRCGMSDVSMVLYDNVRHCIFFDSSAQDAVRDICVWLDSRK